MPSTKASLAAAGLAATILCGATGASAASIAGLYNTGTDATNTALLGGDGVTDPHYQIVSSTSPGFAGLQAVTYYNGAYQAEDADSRWVSLGADGNPGNNTTLYRLVFTLAGLDAATASISGLWGTDNYGSILLNGAATGNTLPAGSNPNNFTVLHSFSINFGFVSGVNTLDFSVTDEGPPTAFRVDNLTGTADPIRGGIPEPATWAMMLVGLFGLGSMLRRKSREAALA
jgi:hypothetical protein